MNERVGFVGLGIMGRPMALNLLKAGFPLWVHARRAAMMEPLIKSGAQACASPGEVARHADIVFTMVSDTADVEQVILGKGGLLADLRSGMAVVDMSTISASATRRIAAELAKLGIDMLDAPVSGGEQGAINATLSIMVGGEEATFTRVLPLFTALGKNIVHVGKHGAGQMAKTCNQIVIAQTMAAVSEAFILAAAADVDPVKVRQALLGGFANSRVLEAHGQRILDADFKPGFKAALHQKDLRIAMQTAQELGLALPGSALATQFINALVGTGGGDLDSSALSTVLERLSGISIRSGRRSKP
jgi:2-hydroxy-3-oxopropionate reductase